MTWSNGENRGFITAERSGVKQKPEILASDLNGFLSTSASYLLFDYVQTSITVLNMLSMSFNPLVCNLLYILDI